MTIELLESLASLGATDPADPAVMDRVARKIHRLERRRVVAPAGMAVGAGAAAAVLVGSVGVGASGHAPGSAATKGPAVASGRPGLTPSGSGLTAPLKQAILAAYSSASGTIAYTSSTWKTPGEPTMEVVDWVSPAGASPGQAQTRRQVITWGGQLDQDVEWSYAVPSAGAPLPPNCSSRENPPSELKRMVAGDRMTVDGNVLDVEYGTKTWSEVSNSCVVVGGVTDAAQIQADIASGDWQVLERSNVDGQAAIEIAWHSAPGATDTLWIDASTYLPIRGEMTDQVGSSGQEGTQTVSTIYAFLPDTQDNQAKLTTPVPPGFRRTATQDLGDGGQGLG